jgi:hypothetical protein
MKAKKLSIKDFSSFSLKKSNLEVVKGGDLTTMINNASVITQALNTSPLHIAPISLHLVIIPPVPPLDYPCPNPVRN